jgi:DNA-binding LacI/PurR family transcriptional regulator
VATRADVAKLAGVSTSTVSYALSGARPISSATRLRIEAAMRELGYTPNVLASGLAGRRTRILALLFPSGPRSIEDTDLQYVVSAAGLARERGYHLVLWTSGDDELRDVRRFSGSGLVDGVLLMEVRLDDARVRFLQTSRIPLAMIGRTTDPGQLAFADADFEQITRLAVDHLAALGHRSLGLLNASRRLVDIGNGPSVRIPAGITRAADDAGARLVILDCESTVAAGRETLPALLDRLPGLTAVISSNWEATVGLIQRATELGRRIPADLSVLSITNSQDRAEITTPALTTISPPADEIARAATAALIDQLEGRREPSATGVLFPGTLVERASTGPAPRPRSSTVR